MKNHSALHLAKISLIVFALLTILSVNLWLGEIKVLASITWIDIFGEGATLGLLLMFFGFVLVSRPRGRVTNLLSLGLIAFCAATFQDILDEIIQLPTSVWFDDFTESALAPFGFVLLGYGFILWNTEQTAINGKLQCKERFYREHSAIDFVTDLYTSLYMTAHLDRELSLHRNEGTPFSLMMIDIAEFDEFNRRYGDEDGDRLLAQAAKLITLNLRARDLACRYAGDRFVVLFPSTHLVDAKVYRQEITNAIENLAFKPSNAARSVFITCHSSLIDHSAGQSSERLFETANKALEEIKLNSASLKAA
ncbi:MAG: GGDEF domain-containing protein [Cellvibrionaceae bacterium]